MKRMVCAAVLAAASTFAGGGVALGHDISVVPPGEGQGTEHPLAKALTPAIFPDGDDPNTTPDSAASQGTNTACDAIPRHAAVTITGGSC